MRGARSRALAARARLRSGGRPVVCRLSTRGSTSSSARTRAPASGAPEPVRTKPVIRPSPETISAGIASPIRPSGPEGSAGRSAPSRSRAGSAEGGGSGSSARPAPAPGSAYPIAPPTRKAAIRSTTVRSMPHDRSDQREPVHVHESAIRDLQVRDHRQRQERELKERLGERAAETADGGAEIEQAVANLFVGPVG